eukprot:3274980-Prymnesium_polylepis.1
MYGAVQRQSNLDLELPVPPEKLCFFSNAGYGPSKNGEKVGGQKINQDRGVLAIPVANNDKQIFFAVFDGHGHQGHKIAQFAADNYFAELELAALDNEDESAENLLLHATKMTDAKLRKVRSTAAQISGTTVIAALLSYDSISVACLGDSRAVLGRERQKPKTGWEAVPLSVDQTIAVKAEADRAGPLAKAHGGMLMEKNGAI